MKTLRFFFATMILLFLAVGISSAQGNKTVTTEYLPWEGEMPCNGDYVTGEETYVTTTWDGKVQLRYKGTYIGESGKMYTWSLLQNYSWKDFVEGTSYNTTNTGTSVIECEGVPFAVSKYRLHGTINANGEITVFFERIEEWVCL